MQVFIICQITVLNHEEGDLPHTTHPSSLCSFRELDSPGVGGGSKEGPPPLHNKVLPWVRALPPSPYHDSK